MYLRLVDDAIFILQLRLVSSYLTELDQRQLIADL